MWRGTMQAARSTEFARPGRQQRLRDRVCAGPSRLMASPCLGGTEAHEELMGRARRIGPLIAVTRDGGEGRTTLTKAGRVRVDYDLDASGIATLRHALDVDGEDRRAAGAEEIVALGAQPASYGRVGGGGTPAEFAGFEAKPQRSTSGRTGACSRPTRWARSGWAPRHATTPWTRGAGSGEVAMTHRSWRALYVGDGSLFPTGIGVNPMITIMALARRASRTILAETPRRAVSAAVGTSSGRGPDWLRRRLVVRAVSSGCARR